VLASGGGMPTSLSVRQTFLLTTLAWTVLSAFAAIPFVLSSTDLGLVDALYEATSGLTTAGGTVIVGLDALPPGPLLWRILLNWIGGIGLVAMTLLVFPFLRVGGMQLFRTESSDRSDKLFGRAKDLAATIATVYAAITRFPQSGFIWRACPGSTPSPTACRRFRREASPPGMLPSPPFPVSRTTGSPPLP
jgi:trk system potassium uptake protein